MDKPSHDKQQVTDNGAEIKRRVLERMYLETARPQWQGHCPQADAHSACTCFSRLGLLSCTVWGPASLVPGVAITMLVSWAIGNVLAMVAVCPLTTRTGWMEFWEVGRVVGVNLVSMTGLWISWGAASMGGGAGAIGMLFWATGLGRTYGERENNYCITSRNFISLVSLKHCQVFYTIYVKWYWVPIFINIHFGVISPIHIRIYNLIEDSSALNGVQTLPYNMVLLDPNLSSFSHTMLLPQVEIKCLIQRLVSPRTCAQYGNNAAIDLNSHSKFLHVREFTSAQLLAL